jgi:glutamate-1-semialdehyde 2,1-aminomutase
VYLAPSQFETAFVSSSHSEKELERTVAAAAKSFKAL